ncbi:hypothetical protein [Miltoncostaea marina]|uniref:hypothetical protein n=1 Tax=Miltoncostaea marina TaxID=2843215 RepID=UPI001C3C504A|nr:hypothetical protein [Miltoncostaea marina]
MAGELRLGETVNGDTRMGTEFGVWSNQFWRLPPLRRLDRVQLRMSAPADEGYYFVCAYGPHARSAGFMEKGSPCQVGTAVGGPAPSLLATQGPGRYLVGVTAAVDGPYRLRLERIQHHVSLSLASPRRLPLGGLVTVKVRGGAGEPLTSPALRVRLTAQFATGETRVLGTATPSRGRVQFRAFPPTDVAPYVYRDYEVSLQARVAPSRHYLGASSARRRVRLG